jgi:ABC-type uncharacterized transport system substrate-binding protein
VSMHSSLSAARDGMKDKLKGSKPVEWRLAHARGRSCSAATNR